MAKSDEKWGKCFTAWHDRRRAGFWKGICNLTMFMS
jgi:hypothetical protein